MKDQFQESASMLRHAEIENRLVREMMLDRFNYDPMQIARGVAKYHLGMVAYAQMLHRLSGHDFGPMPTEDQKQAVAHIMDQIRRWHVSNFGVEPPWVEAVKRAQRESNPTHPHA